MIVRVAGLYGMDIGRFNVKHEPVGASYCVDANQSHLDAGMRSLNSLIHSENKKETWVKLRIDGLVHRSHGKDCYGKLYDGCHPNQDLVSKITDYMANTVRDLHRQYNEG